MHRIYVHIYTEQINCIINMYYSLDKFSRRLYEIYEQNIRAHHKIEYTEQFITSHVKCIKNIYFKNVIFSCPTQQEI